MVTTNAREVLSRGLEGLRTRISDNIRNAGQNATGRTIESLRVEVTEQNGRLTGTLYGRDYFTTLETGTKPWKTAPTNRVPRWFADTIGEWIDAKGLSLNRWAVAHTIINRGSKLYRSGGRNDIYSSEIPKAVESIASQLVAIYDQEITDMLTLNDRQI